ncbi:uncharacterized protein LOC110186114 isoform X2 [Drosophila serrata]|uniref:uncharacterized protein LOC110186114 isoform X2 n=1 Tax=Drosophila serrata TaxID=7274 RepID=UPI000A1D36A9|nr:uncharacterized protein LOC110186114 isoform X2 [Drosophila serrata]
MLKRLLDKMRTPFGVKLKATKDGKKLSKSNCKCEPTACKCGKRRHLKVVSQLQRRDNVSSVILF